ncbi:MAG: hypothetical protein AAFO07_32120, partial [Bacteroidota bacterium]
DHFTRYDGLLSMRYTSNCSYRDADGKIYFGGDYGITIIDPLKVDLNDNAPPIEVSEIFVNKEKVDKTEFFKASTIKKLDFEERFLEFKFAFPEYSDPDNNKFQYTLIQDEDTVMAN